MFKCEKCGNEYKYPAISREDNKTPICPLCGVIEAVNASNLSEEDKQQIIEIQRKATANL